MIVQRLPDQIARWHLIFWPRGDTWIANRVPGQFKHVSAIAWSDRCRTYVWYDVRYGRTEITLYPPGDASEIALATRIAGCSVLQMDALPAPLRLVSFRFWCVPAMGSLVGLSRCGAVPDQFWHRCLQNGAEVIFDGRRQRIRGNRLRSWLAGNRRHEQSERGDAGRAAPGGAEQRNPVDPAVAL